MTYWIKAKISIKVTGISGPFEDTFIQMVTATDSHEAKSKFEAHMRKKHSHMAAEAFTFQYLVIADTI